MKMRRRTRITLVYGLLTLIITILMYSNLSSAESKNVSKPHERVLPVFAVEANEGFPFLLKQMSGRKAILLGDGTHGTDEFYSFRKRVTRNLIRDHGVRIWVLEAEWDSARMVDLYIRGLLNPSIGPRRMLKEAFFRWPEWVWANEEMVEFVLWAKDFNQGRKRPDMVRCFGMDMQMAVDASLEFLRTRFSPGSQLMQKYEDLVFWWEPYVEDPMLLYQEYAWGKETGSLLATELLYSMKEPEPEIRNILEMLIATERYYKAMIHDGYEAWNIRSQHFSSFLLRLFELQEAACGIVAWAHNSHVGDMSANATRESDAVSFGMLMRQALGRENVFLLGSTSYSGTVVAASAWGYTPEVVEVPFSHESSIEAVINSGGWQNPLILFENRQQRQLWSVPMRHRGIGVVYDPENEYLQNYSISRIGERYDALVFWQNTRALQQLVDP